MKVAPLLMVRYIKTSPFVNGILVCRGTFIYHVVDVHKAKLVESLPNRL